MTEAEKLTIQIEMLAETVEQLHRLGGRSDEDWGECWETRDMVEWLEEQMRRKRERWAQLERRVKTATKLSTTTA